MTLEVFVRPRDVYCPQKHLIQYDFWQLFKDGRRAEITYRRWLFLPACTNSTFFRWPSQDLMLKPLPPFLTHFSVNVVQKGLKSLLSSKDEPPNWPFRAFLFLDYSNYVKVKCKILASLVRLKFETLFSLWGVAKL